MNTILPVAIVVVLGAICGVALHRFTQSWVVQSVGAALLATAIWGCGVYLLLWLTAPNELGRPLPAPIFLTFLTAWIPALAVCRQMRRNGRMRTADSSTPAEASDRR